MKIKLPDKIVNSYGLIVIQNQDWLDFLDHIEDFNNILSEGVEVYGKKDYWSVNNCFQYTTGKLLDTQKALLINIKPIKKETAEDVLRDLINLEDYSQRCTLPLIKRAKALLDAEGGSAKREEE